MQNYAITERGKLILVMFVVLFIVLPSVVIVAWIATRDLAPKEPDDGSNGAIQDDIDPAASKQDSDDTPDPAVTQPRSDESGAIPPGTSNDDLPVFNLEAGIMTFLFIPESQTTLDENIVSKIGEFLSSPQNTGDSIIAVNIPHLPDNDTEILTNTLIDALESHEVPLSYIVFNIYQPNPNAHEFEITIFFQ